MLDFVLQGHLKPSAVAKNLEAARGDYCLKNRSKDSTELIKNVNKMNLLKNTGYLMCFS